MNKDFFSNLAESKVLLLISGFASIASLIISVINQDLVLWLIFTVSLMTLIFLIRLVIINSNFVSELDNINLYVFDTAIELESDEDGNYTSSADLLIALQTNLTPKTFNKQPQGEVKIIFPSQLKISFFWRSDIIKKIEETNDSCTFSISLKSGVTFISLRSFIVMDDDFENFLSSRKCLEVQFQNDISLDGKKETIFISTVG